VDSNAALVARKKEFMMQVDGNPLIAKMRKAGRSARVNE
jgi:hypothetical protein